MKTMLNSKRRIMIPLAGILLLSVLFTACKKDKNDNNAPVPVAGLMAFNLSPDRSIAVALGNGSLGNTPLNYTSFTGVYHPVFPGNRTVEAIDFYTGTSIASAIRNFEVNKYYSVFTIGTNGKYRNVLVEDELDSIPSTTGNAFVRYVNGIVDSTSTPTVTVTSGANISNNNAAYGSVSGFTSVTPGDVTIAVNNSDDIAATRTFAVEKDKVYTVLLVGVPGDADPAKVVQIKYVTNGTITP